MPNDAFVMMLLATSLCVATEAQAQTCHRLLRISIRAKPRLFSSITNTVHESGGGSYAVVRKRLKVECWIGPSS